MHDMVAHQIDFGYDAIYHVRAHYLGSHVFVNLYQTKFLSGTGNNNAGSLCIPVISRSRSS